MTAEKKWRIILTKPNREQKTVDELSKKNIQAYFPITRIASSRWNEKANPPGTALFPGYVFVCIDETEFMIVKQTKGFLHFLYWLNTPATISKADISAIQAFLSLYTNVFVEKSPRLFSTGTATNHILENMSSDTTHDAIEKILLSTLGCYICSTGVNVENVNTGTHLFEKQFTSS